MEAGQDSPPKNGNAKEPANPGPTSFRKVGLLVLSGLGFAALVAVGFFFFLRAFVEAYAIEGPSMRPAYADGDRVYVDKTSTPERGDVVIIHSPQSDVEIAKRVIGLPGEEVAIEDNQILVNGEAIERSLLSSAGESVCLQETVGGRTYVIEQSAGMPPNNFPALRIPEGHVYVLGDHRDRSNDSRNLGPIAIEEIVGVISNHYQRAADRGPCGASSR